MFLTPWIVFVGILGFQSLSKHYERPCRQHGRTVKRDCLPMLSIFLYNTLSSHAIYFTSISVFPCYLFLTSITVFPCYLFRKKGFFGTFLLTKNFQFIKSKRCGTKNYLQETSQIGNLLVKISQYSRITPLSQSPVRPFHEKPPVIFILTSGFW